MSTGSERTAGINSTDLLKNRRGSILLEFVSASIMLVFLFLAAVTFSLFFSDYYSIQKVAREAAREACITGSESAGRQKAAEAAWLWGLDPERMEVWFERDSSTNRAIVTCTARYTSQPFYRTFPKLLNRVPLTDVELTARASFGWWDFNK